MSLYFKGFCGVDMSPLYAPMSGAGVRPTGWSDGRALAVSGEVAGELFHHDAPRVIGVGARGPLPRAERSHQMATELDPLIDVVTEERDGQEIRTTSPSASGDASGD